MSASLPETVYAIVCGSANGGLRFQRLRTPQDTRHRDLR